ncbi:membrane protein insertion efficiency factor YidD [Demequina aurantiaca]|uniref:membrane protein insertion efficiency factor YidD n=1 Tax=Demequina aurantiaca TaxID=676200 RepID=UPI0009FDD791|nr:membrane protein insertion efficiency factor YidD [Demequina aurantiaca]
MTGQVAKAARAVASAPSAALIFTIRGYQSVISPLTGPRCKYYPSCSHYGLEAIQRHGALTGSALAAWRVLRCNPWSNGGVDDVPAPGQKRFRISRNNAAMATTDDAVASPRLHSLTSN